MSIFDRPRLYGIGLAVVGAVLLLLGGRALVVLMEWFSIRATIRAGRSVSWEEAIKRCRQGEWVVVVEKNTRPRKVWCVPGRDGSLFFSRKQSRPVRLLIREPPSDEQIYEQAEEFGIRVMEIDPSGTLW